MKKFEGFSENLIFFDTEFSGNNHKSAEILSLGMIKITGEELYIELKNDAPVDDWVTKNVIPALQSEKISKQLAYKRIKKLVGKSNPYLVAFIYPFDYLYLENLLGWDNLRKLFHWPPIDFASILFGNGINPESYYQKDEKNFFNEIGVDASKYKTHNALDDAKLLRDVYLKMNK